MFRFRSCVVALVLWGLACSKRGRELDAAPLAVAVSPEGAYAIAMPQGLIRVAADGTPESQWRWGSALPRTPSSIALSPLRAGRWLVAAAFENAYGRPGDGLYVAGDSGEFQALCPASMIPVGARRPASAFQPSHAQPVAVVRQADGYWLFGLCGEQLRQWRLDASGKRQGDFKVVHEHAVGVDAAAGEGSALVLITAAGVDPKEPARNGVSVHVLQPDGSLQATGLELARGASVSTAVAWGGNGYLVCTQSPGVQCSRLDARGARVWGPVTVFSDEAQGSGDGKRVSIGSAVSIAPRPHGGWAVASGLVEGAAVKGFGSDVDFSVEVASLAEDGKVGSPVRSFDTSVGRRSWPRLASSRTAGLIAWSGDQGARFDWFE